MTTHDHPPLQSILDFAVETAQLAGAYTLGFFNAQTPVEWKKDRTPVTAADRGAEERIRKRIENHFPHHGILGEELGEKTGEVRARWILDPIDGTFSFIHGVPLYCVLIGFESHGEMQVGVIHMPALNETVYAARGLGCWWNGRRASVSPVSDLSQAALLTTEGKGFEKSRTSMQFDRLRKLCGNQRGWSDGYAYALVATGRAEIALDPVMSIWDSAALLPVLLEAGGTFTDWKGHTTHTAGESVATNSRLLPAVLEALKRDE